MCCEGTPPPGGKRENENKKTELNARRVRELDCSSRIELGVRAAPPSVEAEEGSGVVNNPTHIHIYTHTLTHAQHGFVVVQA